MYECSIQIHCEKPNKIPVIEHRFIYRQINHGMEKIGIVDQNDTNKLSTRLETQNYTLKSEPFKQIKAEIEDPMVLD